MAEIKTEQIFVDITCNDGSSKARLKVPPLVSYVDLPCGVIPNKPKWRKHRL